MRSWLGIGHRFAPLAALACLLAPSRAEANGAFPAANQLLADPSDPDHLVLGTTFGVLVTHDHGGSWQWLCEAGLGYRDVQPPMALLPGGFLLLAVPGGVSRGDASGCDFTLAAGITGQVFDLARVPDEDSGVVAVTLSGTSATIWRSADAGATFTPLGDPIPSFIPATLDVAPSDSDVLYVSGLSGTQGVLLRSEDGGASFERFDVPETGTAHRPYIAAVDPHDASTVYVRLDGEPSPLEVTRDGGQSFVTALTTQVPALGFALSPDGSTVLVSNDFDGTFRADAQTLDFRKIACVGPRCLSDTASGLFGCGDDTVHGYFVGRSDDRGATFERVLDLSCVTGPAECPSSTSVGELCPMDWPAIRDSIGATDCAPEPQPPPYEGCFPDAGAGGGSAAGQGAAGGTGAVPAGAGGRGGTGATPGDDTGCGCRLGHGAPDTELAVVVLGALALAERRRRAGRGG